MNDFQQGVAYYPDYIKPGIPHHAETTAEKKLELREKISRDFARMKACGISLVRIGEFSWSTVEPEQGQYNFSVFDQAFEEAEKHGIKILLCTPTACPPKWLCDLHPDILPQNLDGKPRAFGSRRHYDPTSPVFQEFAGQITKVFAKRWGTHPALCGWQVDNELGHHGSFELYTEAAESGFRSFLKDKYESIDQLNESWFTCFWSQGYRHFDEIDLPKATYVEQNPHLLFDFKRFCSKAFTDFLAHQCELIRELSPSQPITTNYISDFYDICPWQMAEPIDFVGFDHYQHGGTPDPTRSLANFTLMQSLIPNQRFQVLEQQPVQVNWLPTNPRLEHDWLFLWAAQSLFLGADAMYYFSWQRFYGGAEQYHDGILPHDTRVEMSWQEKLLRTVMQYKGQLSKQGFFKAQKAKNMLVLHDTESLWSHRISPQSAIYKPEKQLDHTCRLATILGMGVQFCKKLEQELVADFEVLAIPGHAFNLDTTEKQILTEFVKSGGKVISFPRSFMKTRDNQMSGTPFDAWGDKGLVLQEFGALTEGEQETVEWQSQPKTSNRGSLWAEKWHVVDEKWQTLAVFKEGIYQDSPAALIRTESGGGCHLHFATVPEWNSKSLEALKEAMQLAPKLCLDPGSDAQIIPFVETAENDLTSDTSKSKPPKELFAVINFGTSPALLHGSHRRSLQGKINRVTSQNTLETLEWNPGSFAELPGRSIAFLETVSRSE